MTCAQTGSYNDPNRPRRTGPSPTIHLWRPKIPCHQWTWVLSKKKEPTHTSIQLLTDTFPSSFKFVILKNRA